MRKVVGKAKTPSRLVVEFDREVDGRWIAEISSLPGVMAYGASKTEATRRVSAIALRTLADNVEHGKKSVSVSQLFEYEKMANR